MKKLIGICLVCWVSSGFAQEITVKPAFLGDSKFIQNGVEKSVGFTGSNLKSVIAQCNEAVKEVDNYGAFNVISNVLAGVGGFCGGFAAGYYLTSRKAPSSAIVIIGAGSFGAGAILNIMGQSFLKTAEKKYNDFVRKGAVKKE